MNTLECPNCGTTSEGVCRRCLLEGLFTQENELFELPPELGGFRARKRIGRGASGEVWLAFQPGPDREVALKVFLDPRLGGVADRPRFMAEAQALGKLDHPAIVPVYATGEEAGFLFIASRWMPGGTLADRRKEPALARSEWRSIAGTIAKISRAAAHAHQHGLVHRDIKPANILLDADGEPFLADFGIAVAPDEDTPEFTSGTPAYMAPEQASGQGVTTAADIFSLGALMFDLLTGHPPLGDDAKNHAALSGIDSELSSICCRCLELNPNDRYDSASALASDLERWLGGYPVLAHPVGPISHVIKWARRNPGIATLAGTTLVTALSLVVILLLGSGALRKERNHAVEQEELAVNNAHKAITLAEKFRHHAYAADMYAASQAREEGQFGLSRTLLERHLPTPGNPDVRGFEWHAYHALMKGSEDAIFKNHQAAVTAAAFSADGKFLASISEDGHLEVNHIETRKTVLSLPRENALKGALEIPLITKLAWQVPEIRNGILEAKLNFDEVRRRARPSNLGELTSLAWSPDGKMIATGAIGSHTRLWSFPEGQLIGILPHGWTLEIAISADGQSLASLQMVSDGHYQITVHNLKTFEVVTRLPSVEPVLAMQGTQLSYLQLPERTLHLIDLSGSKEALSWPARMRITGLAFSPDGQRITGIDKNAQRMCSWSTKNGLQISEGDLPPGNHLALATFNGGIVTAGNGQTIFIRKPGIPRPIAALQGHEDEVLDLSISPDEQWIASAGRDRTVRLWKMPLLKSQPTPHQQKPRVHLKCHSADGLSWLGETEEGEVILGKGEAARITLSPGGPRNALSFDPGNSRVATWRDDGEHFILEWWSSDSGEKLTEHLIPIDARRPLSAAANTTRTSFAVTGSKSPLQLFDLQTRDLIGTLPSTGAKGKLNIRLSPNNNYAIYLHWPRSAQIGHFGKGWSKKFSLSKGHAGILALSPDGKTIASGGNENKIVIHNVETGDPLGTLTGHRKRITALAFTPDGQTLASASDDRTLRLWHTPTWRELGNLDAISAPSYLGFDETSRRLLASAPYAQQKRVWLYSND